MAIFEKLGNVEEILKLTQNGQFFWKGQELKDGEPLMEDFLFTLKAGPGAVKELVEAAKNFIRNRPPIQGQLLRAALAKFEV